MPSNNRTNTYIASGGLAAGMVAIILNVFNVEGGYSNHPDDRGGVTNYGITETVARQSGFKGDMKDLPKETAFNIYSEQYIKKPNYHLIYDQSPALAEKVIDAGVNVGVGRASRWFQQSLNSFNRGGRDYSNITVDGAIGNQTINAYKSLERVRGRVKACELMIKAMDAHQANHYLSLKSMNSFTVGWFDNRVGNVKYERCNDKP